MKMLGVPMICSAKAGAVTSGGFRLLAYLAGGLATAFLPQGARFERRRVEAELRKLRAELEQHVRDRTRQLEEANKELEAFSYSVSHDLRAPLRAIDGFSNMLLEDYGDKLDAEALNHLGTIRAAAHKMSRLIDDLLQLSRAARSPMRRSRFNLSEMVEAVAAELQKAGPNRKVQLVVAPNCVVSADRNLMCIVIENVLGNAWKFTGQTTTAHIEFGAQGADPDRTYWVRDNGAGFDMDYVHKLFAPFQRLHTADEFPGTGIGLATVQRIIRRHGGQVWIEGAVGHGATVSFTLGEPERGL